MLRVYGASGCGKCEVVKRKLESEGKEFKYSLLEELDKEKQEEILEMAEKEGIKTFPLVFKDGNLLKGGVL